MDFSYRDKHYIRNALTVYISQLKKYREDDEDISEDEFSEMQEDIMFMGDLLYEVERDIKQMKNNASGGSKLYLVSSNDTKKDKE